MSLASRARRPVLLLAAVALAATLIAAVAGAWPRATAGTSDGGAPAPDPIRGVAAADDAQGPGVSGEPVELGPTAADEEVQFNVVLRVPGRARLDAFLTRVADPASPDYRRYLDADGFAERFGLPASEVDRVVTWLEEAGMTILLRDRGRTLLTVRGRAADVNRLLAIRLVDRSDPETGRYHAPDREPRIPVALRDAVLGVVGLDSRPRIRPMFRPPVLGDVPVGGLKPRDGALAYDYAPLHDAGYLGQGQTIAIVSFDTFLDSDVEAFDRAVGNTGAPPVERVPVPADYTPVLGEGSVEVNLDIDVVRAIAPQARILDYEASKETGFEPVFAAILDQGRADIVSVSWGGCEVDLNPIYRALVDIELDRAFAQGVSIFASSGDTGVYSCAHRREATDERVSGVYPSTSPSAISVGGTFLWVREDGSYLREAAWESPIAKVGTGGGPSGSYERPAWQVAPGVDTSEGSLRQTPDVAGPADGDSNYVMVYTPPGEDEPVQGTASGTSAAAPFWAASMVLVRQVAEAQGVGPLGPAGPLLYEVAAQDRTPPPFHDVVLGGNLLEDATPGWDSSTGLGSPDVTALANAIVETLASR